MYNKKRTFLEHPSFLEFGNVCHTLSVRPFVLVEAMIPGLNFTFAPLVWQVALGHNNVEQISSYGEEKKGFIVLKKYEIYEKEERVGVNASKTW